MWEPSRHQFCRFVEVACIFRLPEAEVSARQAILVITEKENEP
jgi:hypothetical protein